MDTGDTGAVGSVGTDTVVVLVTAEHLRAN
jgi:hypothetical protein